MRHATINALNWDWSRTSFISLSEAEDGVETGAETGAEGAGERERLEEERTEADMAGEGGDQAGRGEGALGGLGVVRE